MKHTFYSQHHGQDQAAHPQQVIHCHKTGFCNMNKGAQTGPVGWMETQTRSTAAERSVPLSVLMPSVIRRALAAPFYQHPQDNQVLLGFSFNQVPLVLLRPFSVSFSLSDFTEPLSRCASPGCCPPPAGDGSPERRASEEPV